MKQITLSFILCICGTVFSVAQNTDTNYQATTTISTKTIRTTDKNWRRENNQWFYKDKPTDMFPAFYTEIEETEKTITDVNGNTQKYCYRLRIEVCTQYQTETPDWKWNGAQWEFQGKETDLFPPEYTMKKTEKKTDTDSCND